jgi:hypothetical protein
MLPALRRQERSPSGSSSANAGWAGSSRKCWTGFRSASSAEISHHTAPDEGVIGRSGDAPPFLLPGDTLGDTRGDTVSSGVSPFWSPPSLHMAAHTGAMLRQTRSRLMVLLEPPSPAGRRRPVRKATAAFAYAKRRPSDTTSASHAAGMCTSTRDAAPTTIVHRGNCIAETFCDACPSHDTRWHARAWHRMALGYSGAHCR